MPRYYPETIKEEELPHTFDNAFEPNHLTATEVARVLFTECTWSGYTEQQLEELTGLTYFHSDRVHFDHEAEELLKRIYDRCDQYYYSYPTSSYIAVRFDDRVTKENERVSRPHYYNYHSNKG